METTKKYSAVISRKNREHESGSQGSNMNMQNAEKGKMTENRTLIKHELSAIFKWAYEELGQLMDINQ